MGMIQMKITKKMLVAFAEAARDWNSYADYEEICGDHWQTEKGFM